MPLRKELGWLSVKEMIVKETSTIMYKSLNDLAPQYLSDLFVRLSDFHRRELRNTKNDLAVPLMRTVSGQKAFSCRGTKVWNKFNNDIKEAPSVYSFKSRLRQLGYENLQFCIYCLLSPDVFFHFISFHFNILRRVALHPIEWFSRGPPHKNLQYNK